METCDTDRRVNPTVEAHWRVRPSEISATHDSTTESRWVGDLAALQHAQLTENLLPLLCSLADNVQASNAFAVQAGVLGVTLADEQGHALRDEMADGPRVIVQVSGL